MPSQRSNFAPRQLGRQSVSLQRWLQIYQRKVSTASLIDKVQTFREGHKKLKILPFCFDVTKETTILFISLNTQFYKSRVFCLLFEYFFQIKVLCLDLLHVPKCFVPIQIFWAGQNMTAFSAALKLLCRHKNRFYWIQIIFLSGTKYLWLPQYVNKFLD